MKYFLIFLIVISLSACQVPLEQKNIEKNTSIEAPEIKTNNIQETPPVSNPQTDAIHNKDSFEESLAYQANFWKKSPWKQKIAEKPNKNILDYFYLAEAGRVFCDIGVLPPEEYTKALKENPDDKLLFQDDQETVDRFIVKKNIENDYVLAKSVDGMGIQFARFRNTRGGKDIFITSTEGGPGLCSSFTDSIDTIAAFTLLEWHDTKEWKLIEQKDFFPQKEIENNWKKQEEAYPSYVLPEFGTTIKAYDIYGYDQEILESPLLLYSLSWNGESFDFKSE